MTSGIYLIRNVVTGIAYIGSSVNIERRWAVHKANLRAGRHANSHLQNAWNKHGETGFCFEIVEICERGLTLEREQHWLDTLIPTAKCYNVAVSATAPMMGRKASPETKRKMSESRKGKPLSTQARHRMSEIAKLTPPDSPRYIGGKFKGKLHTLEARKKMSEAKRGRKRTSEQVQRSKAARAGYAHSPETRQRISDGHIRHCKRYEITHPDGRISVVQGLPPFCREHGLTIANMHAVANGSRLHHKGFTCRVIPDNETG